jgi:hypothetical protein
MDSAESTLSGSSECRAVRPIRNDDMAEGDHYVVNSDSWLGRPDPWQGRSPLSRRPAECTLAFNLGNRIVSAVIDDWRCQAQFNDLFLAFYDDCDGHRQKLLVSMQRYTGYRNGSQMRLDMFVREIPA